MSLEQKLLGKRQSLYLKPTEGRVYAHQNVPDFLRKAPLVYDPFPREDPVRGYLAYWSGGRSCIVEDKESRRTFRLKGISFKEHSPKVEYDLSDDLILGGDSDIPYRIEGGQFLQSAKYEIAFCNRWNRVLREEGVLPVMQYRGRYHYPYAIAKKYKMDATLFEVAGDTRVDELMQEIEIIFKQLSPLFYLHTEKMRVEKIKMIVKYGRSLYRSLGFVSESFKKLMDRAGMTWGDSPQNTNAHHGNIVVYPADENHLGVGLVDFDASCDRSEFTQKQLRIQQHCERAEFTGNHLPEVAISGKYTYPYSKAFPMVELRKQFRRGFKEGYAQTFRKTLSNLVDREPYDELMRFLN